jgi:hypothetical protein
VTVVIRGRPFLFKVDTGAARTVICSSVARSLSLHPTGPAITAKTIGCPVTARALHISNWVLGGHLLPSLTVATQPAPPPLAKPIRGGEQFGGMLGADVLSRLGSVTIDFAHDRVVIGARTFSGGREVPLEGGIEAELGGGLRREKRRRRSGIDQIIGGVAVDVDSRDRGDSAVPSPDRLVCDVVNGGCRAGPNAGRDGAGGDAVTSVPFSPDAKHRDVVGQEIDPSGVGVWLLDRRPGVWALIVNTSGGPGRLAVPAGWSGKKHATGDAHAGADSVSLSGPNS